MRTLYWARNDLRVRDNSALFHAAKQTENGMIAVFFITEKLWEKRLYGQKKIDFLLNTLQIFSDNLLKRNIPLLIRKAKNDKEIENRLINLAKHHRCNALFYNKRYELWETILEKSIRRAFEKEALSVFAYDDDTILAPSAVQKNDGNYYSIYTPFKNKWMENFQAASPKLLAKPKKQKKLIARPDKIIRKPLSSDWPAGEKEAEKRLKQFASRQISNYSRDRDFPAIQGTSRLSPYLAIGAISARQCLKAAMQANKSNLNITAWINELIWRDFYKHLIKGFPALCQNKSFKAYGDKIKWKNNRKKFNAWKNGKTGFPIIDAAMNQLNQTGWMHNRLRMIVASFLTKLLLIDWRRGEKYFAEKLIDYDFSANNGGWQWAASTGADSMPYFRLFNPMLQSKKYDPNGDFIRHYCPQYQHLSPKQIHSPQKNAIINYKDARKKALKLFKPYS